MGRILTLLTVSMLVVGSSVALRVSWEALSEPEPAYAQANCTEVLSIGPETENIRTDPFQIQGDTIRLSGNVQSLTEGVFPLLIITPTDESGLAVDYFQTTDNGPFDYNVLASPGTYTLDIETAGDERYSLKVEDCGSSPGGNDPAPSPSAAPSPSPVASPTPSASPSPIDDGTDDLLNAGGPRSGPFPLMPDGSCPEEFPVKRNGACY